MAVGILKWANESKSNPGFSVYYAVPADRDPGMLYVIRQKKKTEEFTPVGWRVFVRNKPDEALTTIFVADTLAKGKQFCEELEELARGIVQEES